MYLHNSQESSKSRDLKCKTVSNHETRRVIPSPCNVCCRIWSVWTLDILFQVNYWRFFRFLLCTLDFTHTLTCCYYISSLKLGAWSRILRYVYRIYAFYYKKYMYTECIHNFHCWGIFLGENVFSCWSVVGRLIVNSRVNLRKFHIFYDSLCI